STPDVTEKLAKNHNHRIDQNWVVKSRLFDMVIGDWDRHDDQWRWAVFKDGDIKTYRPIPRDRDQPFSKYDGLFTGVARLTLPFLKQLKEYREDPGNAKWANYNARQFDKTFMNAMEWEDWAKEVRAIQEKLTDEVVEKAFAVWPEPAREQSKRLQEIVKYRRDNLLDIARAHYELLAREVHVAGTNDRDYFLIERLDDNKMRVRIYETNKKREKKSLYYDRTFLTAETKDVALFGMNDDDYFEISGSVDKGILVRIIGGLDDDEVVDRSKVSGGSKKTWVYDSMDKGNELDLGQEGRDRRSNNRELNIYNRKDYHYEYDFVMPFPILGFNPDDGLFLGTNMTFINYKFKKSPYGQIHQLNGQFAFATGAYNIAYLGDYLETFGKWDFLLDVQLQAPQYVVNFFGLGNESMRDEERSINFYRVRKSLYRLNPSFKKRIAAGSGSFIIGPVLERIKVEDTDDRFIVSDAANLPDQVFESRNYGGVDVRFNYENLDNLQMTTRGISFLSGIEWKTDLADSDISFARLQGSLTIYQSFTPKDRIVLATRIGGGHNFGDFPFHQAHVLGGRTNMRGFRGERFYGGSSFFHNTDLRLKLFNIDNSVLPFSLGVLGGFDYGRVWLDGEEDDNWHSSYGGGIWIAPIDFIVISTNLFISEEDQRFTVGIGFGF
ncbi:MAG: BamA/TamA family outer membrane protein, partial [Bacteroidota bacterium]